MGFLVLGEITVTGPAGERAVTAPRERTLLALLLLRAGQIVSTSQLVDTIWPASPPQRARTQLQGCVHRLRRLLTEVGLPEHTLVTQRSGYRIDVPPGGLDLTEFRQEVAQARRTAASGRPAEAAREFQAALARWRGPALASIDSPTVRAAALALDDEWVQAQQGRIEAELDSGRSAELVPDLTDLIAAYPHQERLHHALMRAYHRAGRQADALAAFQRARTLLVDELGVEPGEDLQALHRAILNGDPVLTPAAGPPPPPVPRELPPDVSGFTGRSHALTELDGLRAGVGDHAPVVISAIAGTAGVGKTALAVRWAHRVTDHFPDGQLYLNLRGYATGQPVTPIEALSTMLRALGLPPEQVPLVEAEASARFRSLLAGRRVLVVLDNARTADQVRPLLPGTPGCLALVTSRDRLPGLVARDGARRISLDVLTPEESYALLSRLLGAARVEAEPGATIELARRCGHLPLALRIAAALVDDHPTDHISGLVERLTAGERLAALAVPGDEETAVRSAFDASYESLPESAQRLFRLLGLVPGPDFTAPTAAALANLPLPAAEQLLRELASAHLAEGTADGRYMFHDLLREYAAEHSRHTDERDSAIDRLLDFYLRHCDTAATLLNPQALQLPVNVSGGPVPLSTIAQAHAWLSAEHRNLVCAVTYAATHDRRRVAWLLADRLRRYFGQNLRTAEWRLVAETALAAANADQNQQAQAAARHSLADLECCLGQYQAALLHFQTAAELARRSDWPVAAAAALANLGLVYSELGQLDTAIDHYHQALEAFRSAEAPSEMRATILTNLGTVERESGRLQSAKRTLSQGLAATRALGSVSGEASALTNLGAVFHDLGELAVARQHLRRALTMHQQVGDRTGEIAALDTLAAVDRDAGDLAGALARAQHCVSLATEVPDHRYEADVFNTVGSICLPLGRVRESATHYQRALEIARSAGARMQEAAAAIGLANAWHRLGDYRLAAEYALRAISGAREYGYGVIEGLALAASAQVRLSERRLGEAEQLAGDSLRSHQRTGHRLGEAHALVLSALIHRQTGESGLARRDQDSARRLFREIGIAAPAQLQSLLRERT